MRAIAQAETEMDRAKKPKSDGDDENESKGRIPRAKQSKGEFEKVFHR